MRDRVNGTSPQPVPSQLFRSVMGSFPTGVTVITTVAETGGPVGMTVNAITSVSLEPPQLLICLAKSRYTASAIQSCGRFAVNFLSNDQKEVAGIFASNAEQKFSTVGYHEGVLDLPLINGSLAIAECEVSNVIDAGDHLIFIGEVVSGRATDGMPLVFFRRNYGIWKAA
ncbi:flavin reductase family protein [Mesorhizobium sp. Z1-4]|uniref:flavin reductase family protein n=1 Tax=Mesorhizobium sp. Z1-4 TaxID=2448478 RepID=UPI000FDC73B8|nr:flavin reductase family protein [Mesorhizobium sp. Z1-4]